MSDTSIHFKDEGYTSPDFLTNLFKKPLYSSYSLPSFDAHAHPHSQKQIHSSTKENTAPQSPFDKRVTSPLKFKSHTTNTVKSFKSTPTIDEQRISNSKFKIFFKTLLHGSINEQELNGLWTKLEESLKNPFSFDKFIDDIRAKKETEAEIKKTKQTNEDTKEVPQKIKAKTPEKATKIELICPNSQLKQKSKTSKEETEKQMRATLKKEVAEIRQVLLKGESLIRKK